MVWQSTPYAVWLVVSAALSLGLSAYALAYAREHGWNATLRWYAVVMVAAGAWALVSLGMVSATTLGAKVFWFTLVNACSGVLVVAWLALALSYTAHEELLRPRFLALVAVEPITFSLLVAPTNGRHPFFLTEETAVVDNGSFLVLDPAFGSWYYFDTFWSWVLVLAGLGLLLRAALSARRVYRGQTVALVVAGLVPLAASVVYVLGLGPHPRVDLTPVSFAVSGIAFWVAIFRYRLLDVVPVARDSVVENMRDGYLVVDPQGRVADLNPAADRILRQVAADPFTDPVGQPAVDRFPALADALAAVDQDPGDGNGAADGDHRHGTAVTVGEGERRRHVEATVSPLFEDDRFVGKLVTLRDVTGRRSVERRYRTLIENSSDMITVLDESGVVTYQSPSVERVMGWPPGVIEGENVFEYLYDEDGRRLLSVFRQGVDDPEFSERFELRVPDAGGDWRVLEGVARNMLDDPAVGGVVINSRDVTERKARERELRRQNERLEEFAGVVSHDLRNPLAVATLHAENAVDDPATHLPAVEGALDRMETMVRDVLSLARQGATVTDPETVDLRTVAESAWSNVETAGATLSVEGTCELAADRDRLLRALENLFGNALEHAGPAVAVRVGTFDSGGERGGGFYVADDGPGVPPGDRQRVFDSGYTTREEGTGFGLAIVRRIAEAHGWEVSVTESAAGGARFEVVGLERVLLEDPAD